MKAKNKKLFRDITVKDIEKIIENLDEQLINQFYKFVEISRTQGLKKLEGVVIEKLHSIWSKESEEIKFDIIPLLWDLQHYINNTKNIDSMKKMESHFIFFYKKHISYYEDLYLYKNQLINQDKLKYIIGKNFINYLIGKINIPLNENNDYKEILYLVENVSIDISCIENLFIQILGRNQYSLNQQESRKKFIEDKFKILKDVNILLKNIKL